MGMRHDFLPWEYSLSGEADGRPVEQKRSQRPFIDNEGPHPEDGSYGVEYDATHAILSGYMRSAWIRALHRTRLTML